MPGCWLVVVVFGIFLFNVVLFGLVLGLWIGLMGCGVSAILLAGLPC